MNEWVKEKTSSTTSIHPSYDSSMLAFAASARVDGGSIPGWGNTNQGIKPCQKLNKNQGGATLRKTNKLNGPGNGPRRVLLDRQRRRSCKLTLLEKRRTSSGKPTQGRNSCWMLDCWCKLTLSPVHRPWLLVATAGEAGHFPKSSSAVRETTDYGVQAGRKLKGMMRKGGYQGHSSLRDTGWTFHKHLWRKGAPGHLGPAMTGPDRWKKKKKKTTSIQVSQSVCQSLDL